MRWRAWLCSAFRSGNPALVHEKSEKRLHIGEEYFPFHRLGMQGNQGAVGSRHDPRSQHMSHIRTKGDQIEVEIGTFLFEIHCNPRPVGLDVRPL